MYYVSVGLQFELSYRFGASIITFFLQNWGDYTDMSQAVVIYVTFFCDVLLICWFGDQLTQHVRQNDLLFFFVDVLDTLRS
jgi:hypothetical protein